MHYVHAALDIYMPFLAVRSYNAVPGIGNQTVFDAYFNGISKVRAESNPSRAKTWVQGLSKCTALRPKTKAGEKCTCLPGAGCRL
jgi:hypothetical protein